MRQTELVARRHDTQDNYSQHNYTQHKGLVCDTQHNNALHFAECHNAECHVLFIVLLSVVMLNVVAPATNLNALTYVQKTFVLKIQGSSGPMLWLSDVLKVRGQCYKTFYGRNLRMLIISQSGCP